MQTIYLDISNKGVIPTIYAKQGDVGRRFLAVLTDAGVPYSPPAGSAFSVWYDGDSGDGNYTDIGSESAFTVNANTVSVELITQMLEKDGEGILCLVLSRADGKQISFWNIPYICEFVPGYESEEANSYFTAFSEAVQNLPYPDTTLSVVGKSADSAAVGEALAGKAPAKQAVKAQPGTIGWYRVGTINAYNCYRITISTVWNNKGDMGAMIDVCASLVNPVLTKVSAAFSQSTVKVVDQVRLVKNPDKSNQYYMDIHWQYSATQDCYVLMDGPAGWFAPWAEWTSLGEDGATAAVTLAL